MRLSIRACFFWVLLAVACSRPRSSSDAGADAGPNTGTPRAFESGSRLRAMVLDAGDGAAWFNGWFDTALGVPCVFMTASDGVLRCLPSIVSDAFDATCTSPIFIPNSATSYDARINPQTCGTVPAYLSAAPGGSPTCGTTRLGAYQVQAQFNPTQVGYPNGQGQCNVVQSNPASIALHTGPALDPSTLVAGHTELIPIDTGALSARVIRADDGASQISGLLDTASGQDCASLALDTVRAGAYLDRCIPTALFASPGVFSDGQCRTPVQAVLAGGCAADAGIALVSVLGSRSCDAGWFSVANLGPVLDAGGWSAGIPGDGGFCFPVWDQVRALGSTLAPDAFTPVVRANLGTGRLRVTSLVDARGNQLMPLSFFDTLYGTVCQPSAFLDGKVRCLATSVGPAFFADPQCSQPVFAQPPPPACGEVSPETYVRGTFGIPGVPFGAGCGILTGGGTLGSPFVPDAAYYDTANGCIQSGFNASGTYLTGDAGDPNVLWPEIDSTVL